MHMPGAIKNSMSDQEHHMTHDQLIKQLELLHADSWKWSLFCCDYHSDDAQDLLQEAYLYVLSKKAKYLGKSSVKTWFFGVIRMISYNKSKTFHSRIKRLKSYMNSLLALDSWSVQHQDRDYSEEVHSAIQQLSSSQQQVIELVFYQDLTLFECAEVMKISIGSVRTHYARAKTKLAHILKQNEVSV